MTKAVNSYIETLNLSKDILYNIKEDNAPLLLTYLDIKDYKVLNLDEIDELIQKFENIGPKNRDRLYDLLRELNSIEKTFSVCSLIYYITKQEERNIIDICWTGPKSDIDIRLTWPVLSEMIINAEQSITIVGFDINCGLGEILKYLEDKSNSGVKLTFMIDKLDNKKSFLKWAKTLIISPELYDRPKDNTDPISKLHVKCIVVDDRVAMVGSSNFTHHGMKDNIELGIILYDEKTVGTIVNLLNELKNNLIVYDINSYI